jgi:Protein of unknown function (DUF3987)
MASNLFIDDVTPDFMMAFLANERPCAGIFTSEAGVLLGGAGFDAERRIQMGSLLNKIWDGQPIRKGRATSGKTEVKSSRLTAHLMLQPVLADMLLTDRALLNLGTCARLLISFPASTIGTRLWTKDAESHTVFPVLEEYDQRIYAQMLKPLAIENGELITHPIKMEALAIRFFVDFYNTVEQALGRGGRYRAIGGFGSKLPEHAARLSAILAAYHDSSAPIISEGTIHQGALLATYYADEMLRLTEHVAIRNELRLARKLAEWLSRLFHETHRAKFHLAEVYQRGPQQIRDAEGARRILHILEEHAWIERLAAGAEVDGAERRDAWRMVHPSSWADDLKEGRR